MIIGAGKSNLQGVTAGKPVKITAAYDLLADHVNQMCGTDWTGTVCGNRFKAWLSKSLDLVD